jgi:uncharacterized membrane protein
VQLASSLNDAKLFAEPVDLLLKQHRLADLSHLVTCCGLSFVLCQHMDSRVNMFLLTDAGADMKRARIFLCILDLGQLWPLMLATPIFVLPIIYVYLTFQCYWHDCGHLLDIINNLFERGYFYSYDWDMDHLNVLFTPFFYMLSPFVYLSRGLFFYLLLHAIAFAACAWAYHKFAKEILGLPSLAALCYFTLIINPYFMASNLYTHYEAFMALGLMGFALFAARAKFWPALLCLMITLSVKPDAWMYGIAASFILLRRVSARHAAVYLVTSAAYYVLVLHFFYPTLYPHAVDRFLQMWAYGHSKGEVLRYLVTHPWDTGRRLITGSALDFNLIYLFLPILAGCQFLPCLAVLYFWVNSTEYSHSSLAFYYNLPCVVLYALTLPFALINLERLWAWLQGRFPNMIPAHTAAQMVLFAIVAVGVVSQVRPPLSLQGSSLSSVLAHELKVRHFVRIHRTLNHVLADHDKSVLAPFTIAPYMLPRHKIFIAFRDAVNVMNGTLRPDFVVFNLNQMDILISEETSRQFLAYMRVSLDYRKVADIENIIIFAKQ